MGELDPAVPGHDVAGRTSGGDFTLEEIACGPAAGVTLCGNGWGVQQDSAYGDATVFTGNKAPFYPKDYIGWWTEKTQKGYIFQAEHWELSARW